MFSIDESGQVNGIDCGRVYKTESLIRGGNTTLRDQWPFIVALYDIRSTPAYICGGTLLSDRHILTGKYHHFVTEQLKYLKG